MKHHPEIPLHMDFCFINRHPYFTKLIRKVNYSIIMQCRGRGRKEILRILQAIVSWHTKRGLQVNEYHAENALNKIEADLLASKLNTQAAGEHGPTSE